MALYILSGNSIITFILLIISLIIVIGLFLVTLFSVFYHRFMYEKKYRPKFDSSYEPRCSIILPCKGIPQNFEENIRSFFELDYKDYEVIFTVESENDPCVPVIKKVIEKNSRASLAVAGITTTCSQKNHNMIAAVNIARNPEVYVFADSDIKLSKNWLKELILPLSQPDISVASGFRWLYSSTGKTGELTNAYQNTMLLVLFSSASFISDTGLWGGSMAMKKRDFDELGVRNYWSQTVVDDMSLSKLIMKSTKKSLMVSTCITPTDDTLPTIRQGIRWFERQVMFLKAYQKKTWVTAIFVVVSCLFFQIWLPVSIIVSALTQRTFIGMGGISSLIFVFGTMSTTLLYPLLGKHPRIFRFLLLQQLSLFTVLIGTFKTLFTNTVKWSGFWYKLNFKGEVISVEQQ